MSEFDNEVWYADCIFHACLIGAFCRWRCTLPKLENKDCDVRILSAMQNNT